MRFYYVTDHHVRWTGTLWNPTIVSYLANINSLHNKLVSSPFFKSLLSFTSLSELNFLCLSFITNQLEIHISICASIGDISSFNGKVVRDVYEDKVYGALINYSKAPSTRAIFMWHVLFICQWTLRLQEQFFFENKRLETAWDLWMTSKNLPVLCVVSSTRTIFCIWQFLFTT